MIAVIVIAVVVVLIVLFFWLGYNGLVKRRNQVDNAWSQIDVQLKRRHDLIPNLVETVKGYAAHERGTFEAVTQRAGQRHQRAVAGRAGPGRERAERRAEEPVRGGRGVPRPQGQPELPEPAGGADELRGPRRLRAAVLQRRVLSYNTQIQKFPTIILAGMFNFEKREFFDAAPEETETPQVQF